MKQCMSFAKGMGMGVVVGIAFAATVKCCCNRNRKVFRKTGKTARVVSGLMDDIQELLK